MIRYALLCVLAAGAPLAHAAGDWVRMDPISGAYWEYDRASVINLPNDQKRILVRMTVSGMLEDKKAGAHYDHAIFLIEFDCAKRQRRVVDVVSYLRAERVQPSRISDDWKDAGEQSVLLKAACG